MSTSKSSKSKSPKAAKANKRAKGKAAAKRTAKPAVDVKYHIEADRATKHGVTRYSKGTVGDKLFTAFDKTGKGKELTLADARAAAAKAELNATSATIGFYQWRKFNGYGKAPRKAVPKAKPAAKKARTAPAKKVAAPAPATVQ